MELTFLLDYWFLSMALTLTDSHTKRPGHPNLPGFHHDGLVPHKALSPAFQAPSFLAVPYCCRFSSGLVNCHHLQAGVSGSRVLPTPANCSLLCIHSDLPEVKI